MIVNLLCEIRGVGCVGYIEFQCCGIQFVQCGQVFVVVCGGDDLGVVGVVLVDQFEVDVVGGVDDEDLGYFMFFLNGGFDILV